MGSAKDFTDINVTELVSRRLNLKIHTISKDQVYAMIDKTPELRDKIIIAILYVSGMRTFECGKL